MALHPKIAELRDLVNQKGIPAIHLCSPAKARENLAASAAALGKGPEVGAVSDIEIDVRWGKLPARVFQPLGQSSGLTVYLHGGGWCIGSVEDFDPLCRFICQDSRTTVLLVDYRLAPEFPYPSGLEDSIDAVNWAWTNRESLLGSRGPIVLAGDSAGANLVAVVINRLKGTIPFAGQVLVYPVTDCDFETASYQAFATGYLLEKEDMLWFYRHYAPRESWHDENISPLRFKSFEGVPITWIGLADHDVLRDDGVRYAQSLQSAGVDVKLQVYEGMTHGFIRMSNLVDVSRQAVSDMSKAIANACSQASAELTKTEVKLSAS